MMDQVIRDFAKQFSYQPVITNAGKLKKRTGFVVSGMGGSHLAADILQTVAPQLDIIIHRDYGLPGVELSKRLFIASSYSGNTEEVVDGLQQALKRKLAVAVVAVGGKLIAIAKKNNLPFVELPAVGIQPRSALGFSFRGLAKLMGLTTLLKQSTALATQLQPGKLEPEGKALAENFFGLIPVIYASARNYSVAYNWKIKFNETGKIPAFCNVIPELNHNEMQGFDITPATKNLGSPFTFVFLCDSADHSRIQKRMDILIQQLRSRRLPVTVLILAGSTGLEKVFQSLLVADWVAFHTAKRYRLEPEAVPMIEEFKKKMK